MELRRIFKTCLLIKSEQARDALQISPTRLPLAVRASVAPQLLKQQLLLLRRRRLLAGALRQLRAALRRAAEASQRL